MAADQETIDQAKRALFLRVEQIVLGNPLGFTIASVLADPTVKMCKQILGVDWVSIRDAVAKYWGRRFVDQANRIVGATYTDLAKVLAAIPTHAESEFGF